MIEIFATYYLIGAIIGLIFWIWGYARAYTRKPINCSISHINNYGLAIGYYTMHKSMD